MKLITLNTWGGKVKQPLMDFIQAYKDTVDIFCFQEIYHDAVNKNTGDLKGVHLELYAELKSLLPDHVGYFCPTVKDYFGIASFIRKDIKVKASGDITIYDNPGNFGADHSRKAQWLDIDHEGNPLSILNVHGLWNGKGKTDTPDRIEQSMRIRNFMDSVKGSQIVCGDLNLLPDTESLSILEKGMRNLVKDNNVMTTRTSLYTRAETSGKYADYIFTSPDIKVLDFKVLPEEVSDHSALYVEFS